MSHKPRYYLKPPPGPDATDLRVLACNLTVSIAEAPAGALAYVSFANRGNGCERVEILLRSHGGRFIRKFESIKRLDHFRPKTIPPAQPIWRRLNDDAYFLEENLRCLKDAKGRANSQHWLGPVRHVTIQKLF